MDEVAGNTGSIAEWVKLIGATGVGGIIMALFARFAFRKFIEEGTGIERSAGETDIIARLREEVDRLASLNDALQTKVTELQAEIIALRAENAELKAEIKLLNLKMTAWKGKP